MTTSLHLTLLSTEYAVCQLPPEAESPAWARGGELLSFTRTVDEFSIVCSSALVPANVKAEMGWRALKVAGPLEFSLVGILASLASALANAGVSIFALSTFDTDYILVKSDTLDRALAALKEAGFRIGEMNK